MVTGDLQRVNIDLTRVKRERLKRYGQTVQLVRSSEGAMAPLAKHGERGIEVAMESARTLAPPPNTGTPSVWSFASLRGPSLKSLLSD